MNTSLLSSGVAENFSQPVDMKEYGAYAASLPIVAANYTGACIQIDWQVLDSFESAAFPLLWLRDHCACDTCRHPQTYERTQFIIDLDPNCLEVAPAISVKGGHLALIWSDGHASRFDAGWLYQRRPQQQAWQSNIVPANQAWAEHFIPHRSDFTKYIAGGSARLAWLHALCRDGFAILQNGPSEGGEIDQVAATIGPIRASNFGGRFEVFSKPKPNNAAYTALGLELHTDLTNWKNPPDIQMLYCLANDAQGGESIFADGVAVAEALREQDPVAFRLLAETVIDCRFADEESDIVVRATVIHLDDNDQVIEVRFNNWLRDSLRLPPAQIMPWYRAYLAFWKILRSPRYRLDLRLAAGEMVAFDNRRVMHGRKSFDPQTGRRHLQGCYVDYDMVESALRVTARQAGGAAV
ncbi:TauD/TfdA family dioxygenase [Pseudomonas sp. MPC6]|uniref:TauD/TfdA family dioxygenase n=1 Tax=unclassified Pseudomonas TaxID=196821 RepID=UPI001E545910|nr:TauD/TfdA family dioxygenase [Pseudomonas sp. MPC6]